MDNYTIYLREWHNQTTLHPLALVCLVGLGIAMLLVPRKFPIIPLLVLSCFIATAQRIVVLGLDFNFTRILLLVGWFRLLIRNETNSFIWKPIDKVIIAWGISSFLSYVLLHQTSTSFIFKLGKSLDTIGMYFLFRFWIRDMEDVKVFTRALLCLSIPVAIFLLIEKNTGRNLFSIFGGVPEETFMRQGKLRAQGAFAHPIIAGCFWVTQLPLFLALWWQGTKKLLSVAGIVATLAIIFACASSTPIAGLGVVLLGGCFFALRHQMAAIRWGSLATLVGLHFVMKAPVWHLVSRIDLVGGSTGWHRYNLIDQTIHRFGQWWLLGTTSTVSWGNALDDTANMYVSQAVGGGFLTLVLFLIIIALAFQGIGRLLPAFENDRVNYIFVWALGVALFAHCMVFIAVSYFGQIIVVWYLLLATIGSLTPVKDIVSNELSVRNLTPRQRLAIKW